MAQHGKTIRSALVPATLRRLAVFQSVLECLSASRGSWGCSLTRRAPHLNGGISRDNVICWNIST